MCYWKKLCVEILLHVSEVDERVYILKNADWYKCWHSVKARYVSLV